MRFPEPKPFIPSAAHQPEPTLVVADGSDGLQLEIEHLAGSIWSLELRLDRRFSQFRRQPFTGRQAELARSPLELAGLTVHAAQSSLTLDAALGGFEWAAGGETALRTEQGAFGFLQTPVRVLAEMQSLTVPDFPDSHPLKPAMQYFDSHQVRFQYALPEGLIMGIPGAPGEPNRRGNRFQLFNSDSSLHVPGQSLYQSWPLLLHRALAGNR